MIYPLPVHQSRSIRKDKIEAASVFTSIQLHNLFNLAYKKTYCNEKIAYLHMDKRYGINFISSLLYIITFNLYVGEWAGKGLENE